MRYTPRQLILYIKEQGYSDQAIANALDCSRVTITNVRLGKGRYTGTSLYRDLMRIVRNLQAQEPQEVKQEPRAQVVTPVAAPPQVWQTVVQTRQATSSNDQYCPSCPFHSLIPPGFDKQQYQAWVKVNYCPNKKSGNCPR